jgi:hypothetical protein
VQPESAQAAPNPTPAPSAAGAPPQDLPVAVPSRGTYPIGLVNQSDFNQQQRGFRGAGARSAVFLPVAPVSVKTSAAEESSANTVGLWNSNRNYKVGDQVSLVESNTNASIYVAVAPSQATPPNPVPALTAAPSPWQQVGSINADNANQGLIQSAVTINAVDTAGNVDLARTGVLPNGSLAVGGNSAFSYSSTTSSITITWAKFTFYKLDGTAVQIPDGSTTITGLPSGSNFTFFPYLDSNNNINFVQAGDVTNLPTLAGVKFSGAGEVTTIVNDSVTATSTRITIEMWVYPTTSGSQTLIQMGASGPKVIINNYVVGVTPSVGQVQVNGGTLLADFWNYVAITIAYGVPSGTNCTVTTYVNNVSTSGLSVGTNASSQLWLLGANSANAIMSRVAIYHALLTSTQISNHFYEMLNAGTGPYDTAVEQDGAVFYWGLQETSGTTAPDSVDSNTGTYTGTFTLAVGESIGGANGTPAIAWEQPTLATTMAQFLQNRNPLSAGGVQISTTASSTGGGISGGFPVPNLPPGIINPI